MCFNAALAPKGKVIVKIVEFVQQFAIGHEWFLEQPDDPEEAQLFMTVSE